MSKRFYQSEKEEEKDIIFLDTAQINNNDNPKLTEAESLVFYIVSNFHCESFNGYLKNAKEVLTGVDQWLQSKVKNGR